MNLKPRASDLPLQLLIGAVQLMIDSNHRIFEPREVALGLDDAVGKRAIHTSENDQLPRSILGLRLVRLQILRTSLAKTRIERFDCSDSFVADGNPQ